MPTGPAETSARREFEDFVRENWGTLMSIASAVAGSRAEAEDLVQTALTGAYARWSRIRPPEAVAYLRRSILNARVSRWRRHRGRELTVAEPVEHRSTTSDTARVDDRRSLLPLLRALPPGQRAVLVLRYLCDLPDDEIATTLAISAVTVRSQSARGLAALRAALSADPEGAIR